MLSRLSATSRYTVISGPEEMVTLLGVLAASRFIWFELGANHWPRAHLAASQHDTTAQLAR